MFPRTPSRVWVGRWREKSRKIKERAERSRPRTVTVKRRALNWSAAGTRLTLFVNGDGGGDVAPSLLGSRNRSDLNGTLQAHVCSQSLPAQASPSASLPCPVRPRTAISVALSFRHFPAKLGSARLLHFPAGPSRRWWEGRRRRRSGGGKGALRHVPRRLHHMTDNKNMAKANTAQKLNQNPRV